MRKKTKFPTKLRASNLIFRRGTILRLILDYNLYCKRMEEDLSSKGKTLNFLPTKILAIDILGSLIVPNESSAWSVIANDENEFGTVAKEAITMLKHGMANITVYTSEEQISKSENVEGKLEKGNHENAKKELTI